VIERVHGEADRRLRRTRQRLSPARRRLLDALADAPHPLTVSELREAIPGLAQSSAYRNLAALAAVRIVARVSSTSEEPDRWELSEDITQRHHHHLLCTACGLVLDYEPSPRLEGAVRNGLAAVARAHRFTADGHRLDVLGRCERCTP
jgi:Fur family ferric uptake transcriptional regulator